MVGKYYLYHGLRHLDSKQLAHPCCSLLAPRASDARFAKRGISAASPARSLPNSTWVGSRGP